MVADSAALSNTSAQSASLAAGRADASSETTESIPRGATLLGSFLPKMKGFADGINRFAEDSVTGVASLSERFLRKVATGVEIGKDATEATQKGMQDFGKRVEEKADFKQWEAGTIERFPNALSSVQENGAWVQQLAPLTAVGLVAEAEVQAVPDSAPAPEHASAAEAQPVVEIEIGDTQVQEAIDVTTPEVIVADASDVIVDMVAGSKKEEVVSADADVASVAADVVAAPETPESDRAVEGTDVAAAAVEAAEPPADSGEESPTKCVDGSSAPLTSTAAQKTDSENA